MAKVTLAVLDNKLSNLQEDMDEVKESVHETNGHVAQAVLDIARHEEQIKAADKKAEQAYRKALEIDEDDAEALYELQEK